MKFYITTIKDGQTVMLWSIGPKGYTWTTKIADAWELAGPVSLNKRAESIRFRHPGIQLNFITDFQAEKLFVQ